MGAWGTGILQNDTTSDIWLEFKELYNKGLSLKEIRIHLEKANKPNDDFEYYSEIWTGIAYGQWMCGEVEEYTFKKIRASTQEKWLTLWAEDKKQLHERINVLQKFIDKIQIPRPNPLKRKVINVRQAFFETGDVIGIKINSNNYIAAIVTSHENYENDGENEIVFTDLIFDDQTTIEEFLKSNIYYLDVGGSNNYYRGFYQAIFTARNMVKQIKKAFIIGKIEISEQLSLGVGTPYGDWLKIGNLIEEQINFIKENKTNKPINVSVNQFLNPEDDLKNILIEWDKKINRETLDYKNTIL